MTELTFLTHVHAKNHSNGRFHPESPERLEVIENWIHDTGLPLEVLNRQATRDEILSVHSSNLYDMIKKTDGIDGIFRIDADTSASKYTYKASTEAVATGITAIERSTKDKSHFALVRPPGHHAYRSLSSGFCIFNNIAIASTLSLERRWFDRIAIIDFDHHYGNGTAAITGSNPDILYFSTHAGPNISFPGCGWVEEQGDGEGKGTSIAVPFNFRATEADFLYAFESVINPLCLQFKPNFIAISVGFDAYERDPVGLLGFSIKGFEIIGKLIKHLVTTLSIPVAHFLEGGYNISALPELMSSYINPFISDDEGIKKIVLDRLRKNVQQHTISQVERLKSLLGDYWEI